MKLTKETLKQIIKEELEAVLSEGSNSPTYDRGYQQGGSQYKLGDVAQQRKDARDDAVRDRMQRSADAMAKGAKDEEEAEAKKDMEKRLKQAISMVVDGEGTPEEAIKYYGLPKSLLNKVAVSASRAKDAAAETSSAEAVERNIRRKVIPWMKKNKASIAKKTNAPEERVSKVLAKMENELTSKRAVAAEKELKDLLGADLYDSIVKGRSVVDKLGGFFKRGTFSEE